MPLTPATYFHDRYYIAQQIAQGGFGTVYKAWDVTLDRPVAIKESFEATEEGQRQFMHEARLLAKLKHPNLPRVIDFFAIPDQGQYLVMEFVEGQTLEELRVLEGGQLPEERTLVWIDQVLDALSYIHRQDPPVIHRDIKPANIRVTPADTTHPQGQAVLVDFGVAKAYDPHKRTTIGARAVTPGFSPYEQYGQAGTNTDARTDIYALGATLYMMLTGQEPPESVARLFDDKLQPARQLNPALSSQIELVIQKALNNNPTQRYQTAQEFRAALSGLLPVVLTAQPAVATPAPAAPTSPLAANLQPPSPQPPIAQPAGAPAQPTTQPGVAYPRSQRARKSRLPVSPPQAANLQTPSPQPAVGQPTRAVAQPVRPSVQVFAGMEFMLVPEGQFLMGSRHDNTFDNYREQPQHTVVIARDYWLARFPVTNRQFEKYFNATRRKHKWISGWEQKRDHPVVNVTWHDAMAFCAWLNQTYGGELPQGYIFRLPTEAEWEKAARGENGFEWPWGNDFVSAKCNSEEGKKGGTTPVGAYSPQGDSPYGCADMAGNVWEWTHSLFRSYPYKAGDGREDPKPKNSRVLRGGSFSCDHWLARCACRSRGYPSLWLAVDGGFRVGVVSPIPISGR